MVEWMLPGEVVIKDSGRLPVTYDKALAKIDGKLYLTNMRLVFQPNRFQELLPRLMGLHKLIVQIPLNTITSVERTLGRLTVYADGKHDFMILKNAGDWLTAINKSRQQVT